MNTNELPDEEQIKMLEGIFEHSDFTRRGHRIFKLKSKLDKLELELGRLTVEDASGLIKTRGELDHLALLYDPAPFWLIDLMRGVLVGRVKMTKNVKQAHWTRGLDIAGIYGELTERFGFDKKLVRQFIAEKLNVPGNDTPSETYGCDSLGADKVRKEIARYRKK